MQPQLREIANGVATAPPPPLAAPHYTPSAEGPALELIKRWLELSELERRAFVALARELTVSSELVERSTLDLSERFQTLAQIAQGQVGRVDQVIAVASALSVDGEAVSLDAALQSVEVTLRKAIETILFVSKHAMRMVYTLDDVAGHVAAAEQCSGQIELINRQTRYLALNAAIEANRSGAAGGPFSVIAHEMKQLSQATEATAVQVRERISSVAFGVRQGHDVLREIATMDLSENILAKDRIDSLLAGIARQHSAFHAILADTAHSSTEMANTIGQLITGIQFQDRTKQHIAQVIETLGVLEDGTVAAQLATDTAFPGMFAPGSIDSTALRRIIEKQTLGAMKERLLNRLLDGGDGAAQADDMHDSADDGGDIELF